MVWTPVVLGAAPGINDVPKMHAMSGHAAGVPSATTWNLTHRFSDKTSAVESTVRFNATVIVHDG